MRFPSLALATLVACASPALLSAADDAVLEAQQRRTEVVERVASSVVAIFGAGGGGGGSGVIISPDGYAVTNFHVTNGAGDFMKCGLNDGKLYDAVIVGIDPTGDVALIKLLGRDDFPFSQLGDSDEVRVGDWAYAMGNPFLLATDFSPTVTYGIVSGVHRYQEPAGNNFLEYTDCIQIDTSINPGNSGGPLFNEQGEVIGINGRGSFEKRGRVNSGAGYAISSNQVKLFLDHLESGRIVDHATLGATVATDDEGVVRVANILEESEAYRRGLRIDDEIVHFGGRPIGSVNQFKNVLGIYPKGWKVPLVYRRDGQKHEIVVRLRALHHASELAPKQKPPGHPQPMPDEEPKDEEQPEGEKPEGEGEPKDGEKPKPKPVRLNPHATKPPKEYEHMLVKKPGYANYYFNELNRKRVLAALDGLGDLDPARELLRLEGRTGADADVVFTLADDGAGLEMGKAVFFQAFDGSELLEQPPLSGGLLVAADQLRRLLADRAEGFTDFYYLGSERLDGTGPLVDVLIATKSTATSRFYFDKAEGGLVGFDTTLTDDVDPCEIRFGEWREFDGRRLPAVWNVNYAAEPYVTITLTDAAFGKQAAAAAESE